MTDCTERSEGQEGMPGQPSMTDCTERSEGQEGTPGQPSMTDRTEHSEGQEGTPGQPSMTDRTEHSEGQEGPPTIGPATDAGYRDVLRHLTRLDDEAAAHRAEAVRWHDGRAAAADDAVRTAEENVRAAERAVRAAQREREAVDARAAGLWSDFVHKVGPVAERFGRTVPPATVPRQLDREAEEYLQDVASTVAYVPPARPLTGGTKLLFVAFGFIGGAVGVAAHQLLRWAGRAAGGDWATALPVLALIVLLLGPVLAVVGAKRVADRRGTGLDATAIATVLISGLITAGLLLAALGAG
jgi:hypothetical protein